MTQDMTQGKIIPMLVHFTIPLVLGNLFQLTYNPVFDSQKRNKVVQSPSIKALSHFFALLRIIVFFSYLLFDV